VLSHGLQSDAMEDPVPHALSRHPIHLGLGATAVSEPEFDGMSWYEGYAARHAADGAEGRLVSMYTFHEPWTSWEMHPEGSEVVLCTAGELTLIQEIDGQHVTTSLRPGEYAINAPGVWHTADADGPVTAVFITAGLGTQHRAR
jgi:quercetin dioxygenase-like cupin family protein